MVTLVHDLLYLIFELILRHPMDPGETTNPIMAIDLLRSAYHTTPENFEQWDQYLTLRLVCHQWDEILIESKIKRLVYNRFKPIRMWKSSTLCVSDLDWFTMSPLHDVLHLRIELLDPVKDGCVLHLDLPLLFTLSLNIWHPYDLTAYTRIPYENWSLPSLKSLDWQVDNAHVDDASALLGNVGRTITTLSYHGWIREDDIPPSRPAAIDFEIWRWCPNLLVFRTSVGRFSELAPPSLITFPPIHFYLSDFDDSSHSPDRCDSVTPDQFRIQLTIWGKAIRRVSFATTWYAYFQYLSAAYEFEDVMIALEAVSRSIHDVTGVPSNDRDIGKQRQSALDDEWYGN